MYNKKESTEDYLEKILLAKEEYPSLRAINLAHYIHYSKASVSIALKKLKDQGLVIVNEYDGEISLTPKGLKIAQETLDRHITLTKAFIALGVDKLTAENDACKIEHLLSEKTFACIKEKMKKM